jgi:GNAT superfamily N-acetyltransferase
MIIETHLNDGRPVCIREVRREDEQRLKEGIARLSPQSRYLRFFSGMREAPQPVLDLLLDVDGHDHIAWGAIGSEMPGEPALGVVHAFRDDEDPATAEFSVAVVDEYHGLGVARLLTAVLLYECRREGFDQLTVHILAENRSAMALARLLGARFTGRDAGVSEFEIDVRDALGALRQDTGAPGLKEVFAQIEGGDA